MIAILISAYSSYDRITKLIDFFDDKRFFIMIHINKLSNKKLHDDVFLYVKNKKTNIHILEPIEIYWSHFSHVEQKFNSMKYLIENKINFDYYINITENDCPLKTINEIYDFCISNKEKSFFYDFFENGSNVKMYYQDVRPIIDIKKKLRLINNEILFTKKNLYRNWKFFYHPRNNNANPNLKSKLRFLFHSPFFMLYILLPCKLTFYLSQNYYFYKGCNSKEYEMFSEWQYSITSFFSSGFVNFLVDLEKEIFSKNFSGIYAPDESVWITLAKKYNFKNCVFNWKPLILSTYEYLTNKDGTKPFLSWCFKDLKSIYQGNTGKELFCRRMPNDKIFNILMDKVKDVK